MPQFHYPASSESPAPKTSTKPRQVCSRSMGIDLYEFARIWYEVHVNSYEFIQISPLLTPSFALTHGAHTPHARVHAPWPRATMLRGRVVFSHSALATLEPPLWGRKGLPVGKKPSSCTARVRVYTDGLLPMLCPFGRIPPMRHQAIINGVVVHKQLHPYATLAHPRCCATIASASGDSPPWQSRRTLTRFSKKKAHVVDPMMHPQKLAPLEVTVGSAHGLCYVSGAAPSGLPRNMRNAKRTRTCLQNSPTTCCTPTSNFPLLLDAASHWGDGIGTLHPYGPLAVCLLII